jgi:hypothetical protein
MSEPRRIIIGVIPSGQDVTYVGEGAVDPVAFLIDEANAKLDAERAAEARALAAKAPETDLLAFLRPRPDSGIGAARLCPHLRSRTGRRLNAATRRAIKTKIPIRPNQTMCTSLNSDLQRLWSVLKPSLCFVYAY